MILLFAATVWMFCLTSCKTPAELKFRKLTDLPESFSDSRDTTTTAAIKWRDFFRDRYLAQLIDTALKNNQELNITLQEINIARNEVRARKGEYLPAVGIFGDAGIEKVGRYTSQGANDANTDIKPGEEFPEPLPDFRIGLKASWELDIWGKLRNAKKAAVYRYLATQEGRNFMVTNLVAEVAESYFELLAYDNQLRILQQNIEIQLNALSIMKMEKDAAKVTELAVRKFEAEVFKNRSRVYEIMQKIRETENRINFLTGRFPRPVERVSDSFLTFNTDTVYSGTPIQLVRNRPDIRQAEMELRAAKLDVRSARAMFLPSFGLGAGVGYRGFDPKLLFRTPESLIYSLAADMVSPLINRNAIKAVFNSASSRQIQQVLKYEQTVLKAYLETINQISKSNNLSRSLELKLQQVDALNKCTNISTVLFKSARADYMEVLMTQRDVLEAEFELVETKEEQLKTQVALYKSLGGGWK